MILDWCIVVMWMHVQMDLQLDKQLSAHTCARLIWALSCHVPSVPEPSSTLKPSNVMASRYMPLGPETLCKVYFLIFALLKP